MHWVVSPGSPAISSRKNPLLVEVVNMPIRWQLEQDEVAVFRVSEKLDKDELEQVQSECETAIQKIGNIKILVILENFSGWKKAEGWEDTSFASRNDAYIDKMAIVGDSEWRDLAYAFTLKGLRPVPIEYFNATQETEARAWLING